MTCRLCCFSAIGLAICRGITRHRRLDHRDWSKRLCLKWLRARGITRPVFDDLKFTESQNYVKKYGRRDWFVVSSLRRSEETMIKLYQGIE